MYHLKHTPLDFLSTHDLRAWVEEKCRCTRHLYGRFKALASLVLFCLLEIKRKKQIHNINWVSMLQNLISSAVHPNSNCPHSDPPPPPLSRTPPAPPFFRPYKDRSLLWMPLGWRTIMDVHFFFSFLHFFPVPPLVHFKAVFYHQQKVHMTFLTTTFATVFLRLEQRFNVESENDLKTTAWTELVLFIFGANTPNSNFSRL